MQHKPYTAPVRMKADLIITVKKKEKDDNNDMYTYSIIQNERTEKDSQQLEI